MIFRVIASLKHMSPNIICFSSFTIFRCFIFAPHFGQNASLSSTNTWHFGQRGTGWLSALTGIIVPHLEQCRVVLRGIQKTNGPNISANNMASPKPVRGSTTVSFLQVSQYARIFSPLYSVLSWLDNAFNWFALGWFAQNQKTLVEAFISYNNQVFSCLVSSFQQNINFRHHTFQCFFVLLFEPLFANKLDCMQMRLLRMPQQHATS